MTTVWNHDSMEQPLERRQVKLAELGDKPREGPKDRQHDHFYNLSHVAYGPLICGSFLRVHVEKPMQSPLLLQCFIPGRILGGLAGDYN